MARPTVLTLALAAAVALAACHKAPPPPNNQEIAVEGNLDSGLPPNAEIETLPPDESSVTSNGELAKGNDNPDVNDLGNGH